LFWCHNGPESIISKQIVDKLNCLVDNRGALNDAGLEPRQYEDNT